MYGENGAQMRAELAALLRQHRIMRRLAAESPASWAVIDASQLLERVVELAHEAVHTRIQSAPRVSPRQPSVDVSTRAIASKGRNTSWGSPRSSRTRSTSQRRASSGSSGPKRVEASTAASPP